MTHKPGTDLGGVRSVAALMDRCRVDPITGCWIWALSKHAGIPRVHLVLPDGSKHTQRGRRAALMLKHGCELPSGRFVWQTSSCNSIDCVNPDHARSGSRKQWGAWVAQDGRLKGLPTKVRAAHDARKTKATPEIVAAILADAQASQQQLAQRLGVSRYTVWTVRKRGGAPIRLAANASAFNWKGLA